MSPEQAARYLDQVDPKNDIYALGRIQPRFERMWRECRASSAPRHCGLSCGSGSHVRYTIALELAADIERYMKVRRGVLIVKAY